MCSNIIKDQAHTVSRFGRIHFSDLAIAGRKDCRNDSILVLLAAFLHFFKFYYSRVDLLGGGEKKQKNVLLIGFPFATVLFNDHFMRTGLECLAELWEPQRAFRFLLSVWWGSVRCQLSPLVPWTQFPLNLQLVPPPPLLKGAILCWCSLNTNKATQHPHWDSVR